MPDGIVESVKEVKEHGADVARVSPIPRLEVGSFDIDISTGIFLLPSVATAVDGEGEGKENGHHSLGTDSTADGFEIKEGSNDGGGHDLSEPVKEVVQGTSAGVEVGGIDGVLLVSVEPVGREEHGEEQENEGLRHEGGVETHDLGAPAGVLHEDNLGAVATDDVATVADEESQTGTGKHEHNEGDVGTVVDAGGLLGVDVLAEGDQTTNASADVEDGPEPGPVAALFLLGGVGDHDDALGGPQETGTDTEESTSEDVEAVDLFVDGDQQRDGVEAVANTAQAQTHANTETVDNTTGSETDDGKSRVQSSVLGYCQLGKRIKLQTEVTDHVVSQ